jgi:hypothetical protein
MADGAGETLFDAVQRQLDRHGYIARCDQLVAPVSYPHPNNT